MAKEYIDREAARLAYERSLKANTHNSVVSKVVHSQEHRHMLHVLDKIPAADVVEVVRCKDCKYWDEKTGWCDKHSHFTLSDGGFCHPWESADWKMFDADYFCADGERRAEDGRA